MAIVVVALVWALLSLDVVSHAGRPNFPRPARLAKENKIKRETRNRKVRRVCARCAHDRRVCAFFVFFFTALLAVCPAGCAFADVASASLSATDGDVIAIQGGTYAATPAATISARLTLRCALSSMIFTLIFPWRCCSLYFFFFFSSLSFLWRCAARRRHEDRACARARRSLVSAV